MNMSNASDEDQLVAEGFVDVRLCPGCKLLRGEIKRLRYTLQKGIQLVRQVESSLPNHEPIECERLWAWRVKAAKVP